jgi:hypothetical protein
MADLIRHRHREPRKNFESPADDDVQGILRLVLIGLMSSPSPVSIPEISTAIGDSLKFGHIGITCKWLRQQGYVSRTRPREFRAGQVKRGEYRWLLTPYGREYAYELGLLDQPIRKVS